MAGGKKPKALAHDSGRTPAKFTSEAVQLALRIGIKPGLYGCLHVLIVLQRLECSTYSYEQKPFSSDVFTPNHITKDSNPANGEQDQEIIRGEDRYVAKSEYKHTPVQQK